MSQVITKGPSQSGASIKPQALANNGGKMPTFGGLSWSSFQVPQGATEYSANAPGGGYYVFGPDMELYHEPVKEQAGLDVSGYPSPHGGGGFLLAQSVASFFGANAPKTTPTVTPTLPNMNRNTSSGSSSGSTSTGKGGSSTGTGTTTGGNTTNPTPEGGVSTTGGIDPYTQALLDLIAQSNGGANAGANYIPYSSGGIVPSSSGTTTTSSTSLWLIIGILAIVGAGGWWVYHKYIKKDFDEGKLKL